MRGSGQPTPLVLVFHERWRSESLSMGRRTLSVFGSYGRDLAASLAFGRTAWMAALVLRLNGAIRVAYRVTESKPMIDGESGAVALARPGRHMPTVGLSPERAAAAARHGLRVGPRRSQSRY